MPCYREQIHAEIFHADWDLTRRLCRIGEHQRTVLVNYSCDLGDSLDRSDFVVGVHNSHQNSLRCKSLLDG